MCGTSRWKAAKAASKTMQHLDETGVVIAGCRHIIAQKALNMFRAWGNVHVYIFYCSNVVLLYICRYGYTHFLHMHYLSQRNLDFLMQDVICRYWPWTSQVNFPCDAAYRMIPCLPVMHAKAHTWHCQVVLYNYV